MEYVEISKVINIELGKTPSRNNTDYWNGENTWITIADMTQKYIEESKEKITDIAIKNTKIKKVPQNTVIMSFKLSIGKRAITKAEVYTNEAIAAFHIKDLKSLIPEYLYYALESVDFLKYTDKAVKGKTLNKEKLKKIRIPISSLSVQLKISKILNKIQKIIENKRKQIILFDELIKSRFIEMFGDPIKNDKGWDKIFIEEIASLVSRGKTPKYVEKSKIGVINQACVYWEKIKFENIKYHEDKKDILILQDQDILINSTGTGTLGRVNIFMKNEEKDIIYTIDTHITLLRLKQWKSNSIYLKNYFRIPIIQKYLINKCVNGSTNQIELSKEKFNNFKVLLPALYFQKEFSQFVEKTDKLKFYSKKYLRKVVNIRTIKIL